MAFVKEKDSNYGRMEENIKVIGLKIQPILEED